MGGGLCKKETGFVFVALFPFHFCAKHRPVFKKSTNFKCEWAVFLLNDVLWVKLVFPVPCY